MKILAIDPAKRTGWAHSDGRLYEHGHWNLGKDTGVRPIFLGELIESTVRKLGADIIAFELATFGSRFAYVQAQHNELAGAIRLTAGRLGLQCWGFVPSQWKSRAVANGNARIDEVKRGLQVFHHLVVSDNDEAAAIGILLAAQLGPPPESKKKQRKAAEKRLKKTAKLF